MRVPDGLFKKLAWDQGWDRKSVIPLLTRIRAYRAASQTYDPTQSTGEWERRALAVLRENSFITPDAADALDVSRENKANRKALAEEGLARAQAAVAAMRGGG